MGYVHQMDAAWLLRPWILDVTPLFGTPHWFSTQHLILSQQLFKPQLHKDMASGKGALLRGAHVETVNCLELVVFLVSDRCHYESLETINTLQCPVRLLPCTRTPRGTFWELGLKCFWYCGLRIPLWAHKVSKKSQGRLFSELFLIFFDNTYYP